MFISWSVNVVNRQIHDSSEPNNPRREDLLSSSMLAAPPCFSRAPCGTIVEELPFPSPMATLLPDPDIANEVCLEMTNILDNLRYISDCLNNWGRTKTMDDMMIYGRMRSTLEHRLLTLKVRKPQWEMTALDYQLEVCRLAAIAYIQIVFHNFHPFCSILRNSKDQLKELIREGEEKGFRHIDLQLRPGSLSWGLFIGGLLSLNMEEKTWFALRIATTLKALHGPHPRHWADMENFLKEISWTDRLKPDGLLLWHRVRDILGIDTGQQGFSMFSINDCVSP